MIKLKCPYCGKVAPKAEWKEDYAECELCGNRQGIACPNWFCGFVFNECTEEYPIEI